MIKGIIRNFSKNPYKVLGVNRQASDAEIKQAYLKLAKKYHPDVATGQEETFKLINEAYCVLKLRDEKEVKEVEPEFEYEAKDLLWRKEWGGFRDAADRDDEERVRFFTVKKSLVNFEILSIG